MSGGVDSAVAALLCARDGDDASPSRSSCGRDPENDGERSCCSAAAVRGARRSRTALGLPHFTLDLRDEFRAGVVEPWLAEHAAGPDAEPVRALQRPRAPRRDARLRRRASAPRRWPPATTRAARADGLLRARRRPGQGPDLHARRRSRPRRSRGCASRSASSRSRRCARSRPRPASPSPRKPDSQDLCFLAGTGRADVPRPPRRACASAPATSSTATARVVGRHGGHHGFTVGQRRGLGVGGARRRSTCSRPTPARTPSRSARATTLATRDRPRCATCALHGGRAVDAVRAALPLAGVRCRAATATTIAPRRARRRRRAGADRRACWRATHRRAATPVSAQRLPHSSRR